jgi:protein-S-isoprenylcysteine O-methyltransferase Ste14
MALELSDYCYLAGLAVGCAIRRLQTGSRRAGAVVASRRTASDVLSVALSSLGMFVLPLLHLATEWPKAADFVLAPGLSALATVMGCVLFASALWLLWRSHSDLGRAWSMFPEVREGQGLVTSGVYTRIRHPMYAAHFLWALAQALLLHNWIVGPSMLVTMIPFYFVRVRQEEGLMREHFGAQYEAYAGRTGRILPGRRPRAQ